MDLPQCIRVCLRRDPPQSWDTLQKTKNARECLRRTEQQNEKRSFYSQKCKKKSEIEERLTLHSHRSRVGVGVVNVGERALVHAGLERGDVLYGEHAVHLHRIVGWRYHVLVFDTGCADIRRRIHDDVLPSTVAVVVGDDVLQRILEIAKDIGEFPLNVLKGRAFGETAELNGFSRDNFLRRRCELQIRKGCRKGRIE